MIDVARLVEFELLSTGGRLWKSVECDGSRGRFLVYANLNASDTVTGSGHVDAAEPAAAPRFAESAAIIRRVLESRLTARDWIAAVLCGDRLSYTIRPN